jgi:uncharacterized protein YuzE
MQFRWDAADDALTITLDAHARIEDSAMVTPDLILDYDAAGQLVAIEILRLSQHAGAAALLAGVNPAHS